MRLYVANCSTQTHVFYYRVPGVNYRNERQITIEAGTQKCLPDDDLDKFQIDDIVGKQHGHYGLLEASEANRAKGFRGLCYSIDKPVTHDRIYAVMLNNQDELARIGREIREQVAVAANKEIEDSIDRDRLPNPLEKLSVTIRQMNTDPRDDQAPLTEDIHVSRNEAGGTPSPGNRRRKAA